MGTLKDLSRLHKQVFENWPETQSREERESAHNQNRGDQQTGEQTASYREGASRCGNNPFFSQAARDGHDRNDHEKSAEELRSTGRRVVPESIWVQPPESRTIVGRGGNVGVQDLCQPMWARIRDTRRSVRLDDGYGREAQDCKRQDEYCQHGHLDVVRLDFLAQILRGTADHQAGDKYREDYKDEHSVQPSAHATENNFPEHHVDERNHTAEGCERMVRTIHRAATGVRGDGGEERRVGDPEAHFLSFHVSARLQRSYTLVRVGEEGIAFGFGPVSRGHAE